MDLLTVREAAGELSITERAVRYRLEQGILRGERVGVWLWLIPRSEVERAKREPPTKGRPRTATPPPPASEE